MTLHWREESVLLSRTDLSTKELPMSCDCPDTVNPQLAADIEALVHTLDVQCQAAFGLNFQGVLSNLTRCAAQNVNVPGVFACIASGQKLQNCILPNLNLGGFITCALASFRLPTAPPSPTGPQASTKARCN